jgi:predicted DNA-binding protein with PD1-like motif
MIPKLDPSAVHEAGHALAAHLLGGVVETCEIFDAGGGRHSARRVPYRKRLCVKLAGHVAARVALGAAAANPDRAGSDIAKACRIALRIAHGDEARAEALLLAAEHEVETILAANVGVLRRIAARLQEDGSISGEAVAAIVSGVPA